MTSTLIGISIKLIGVVSFVWIAVLVKTMPDELPTTQLIFFRCSLALPFVIGFAFQQSHFDMIKTKASLTPKYIWLHIRRSFFGLTCMFLIFYSVRNAPLPIANSLLQLAPILITLLAALFLGETIRLIRTAGLILGVIGVSMIAYDTINGSLVSAFGSKVIWGVIAALGAALTMALAQIQIRSMVGREHPSAIVSFFFLMGCIATLPFAPFGWEWPSALGWLWLAGIGCAGGIGQLGLTIAYRYADASTLAPFEYFSIPLSLIFGGFLFGEWPHKYSSIGIAFILAGGLIIIYREGQLANRERKSKR